MSKRVPKRRFHKKDISLQWKSRKVKDLCSISTGKSNTQDKSAEGPYPFYVRSPIVEKSNKYIFDEEAVLTVGDGVGTGKVFHYVNGKYDLHQRVYRMYNFVEDISGKFFYYYFSHFFYDRVMSMTAKTSVDSVRLEMIAEMNVLYPSKDEQKKIVEWLDNINYLIDNYHQKYDKLQALKKAYLYEMFPQEGESVPKRRFAGVSGEWEKCKLGELVDIFDGVHQTPNYKDEGVMFLSVENIQTLTSNKYISEEDFQRDYKVYPRKNDILMTRIGDIGTTHVVEDDTPKAYYVSLALLKYKNTDSYFLSNVIQTEYVKKGLRTHSLLTAVPMKINKEEIGKVEVLYPKKEEQEKIGKFFEKIDKNISKIHNKLQKLKALKQAYLAEMFV